MSAISLFNVASLEFINSSSDAIVVDVDVLVGASVFVFSISLFTIIVLDFLKNNKDWKEVVISPILKFKTITTKSGEEKIITSSARQAITRGFIDVVKKLEDSNYFEVNEDEFGVFHIYKKI